MKVKYGTRKADELIYDMFRTYYKGTTLYEVYDRASSAKVKSWELIKRECARLNGERLHITGASCHQYSCMYAFPIINEDTGEIEKMILRKETSANTYDLEMPIEEYLKRY